MNVSVDAVHAMIHSLKHMVFPFFRYNIWIGALFLPQSFSNIISVQTLYFFHFFLFNKNNESLLFRVFISVIWFRRMWFFARCHPVVLCACTNDKWFRLSAFAFVLCCCSMLQDSRLKSSFIQNWRDLFLRMAISWIFDRINKTITEDQLASKQANMYAKRKYFMLMQNFHIPLYVNRSPATG